MKKKRNFAISGKCYRPFEIAGERGCLVCAHYTGARELIQCKRWIKELQEGTCKFNEKRHACRRFELMEELKNKNMTILEKVAYLRGLSEGLGIDETNIITIRMQSLIMTIFLRKNSPKLSYGIKRTAAQIIGNYPIHNRRHMRIGGGGKFKSMLYIFLPVFKILY